MLQSKHLRVAKKQCDINSQRSILLNRLFFVILQGKYWSVAKLNRSKSKLRLSVSKLNFSILRHLPYSDMDSKEYDHNEDVRQNKLYKLPAT